MNILLILTQVALILGFILAASMATDVVRNQRTPAGTIAWLLVIVLMPYVGVPLYMMLGGRKMHRLAGSKSNLRLPEHKDKLPEERPVIIRLFRNIGLPGATPGNRVRLCQTGEEAFAEFMEIIDGAERSIHITTYLLAPDEVGREVVHRLARRASQGLDVKLLLDAVGSFDVSGKFLKPLTDSGGSVARFMPVVHFPFRGRSNLRNHRKIVVADERWVMAGGTNISTQYLGPLPSPQRWRDMTFVLEGPAARDYERIFIADWEFASGEKLSLNAEPAGSATDPEPGALVQVIPSGPDVPGDPLYDAILSVIFEAKERLWIVTPYFIPDQTLLKALQIAAHRGVDVLILMPEKSNHRLLDVARGQYLREIQYAGGRILFYTGGMMHAKVMLMDDGLAVIGSANLDMRSLFLNYEVVMFMYSKLEVKATEDWIAALTPSFQAKEESPTALKEIKEGMVRMLTPLL